MLSLYVHIPFCEKKCKYCSFNVIPMEGIQDAESMQKKYLDELKKEIAEYGKILAEGEKKQDIYSLYFGGGTPSSIGKENLAELIDCVAENFDLEGMAELSIELNPFPPEEILELIDFVQKKYKIFPRIRRSIGLQTFDTVVLQESGRMYSFPAVVDFLRELQRNKAPNSVFNFDFIAFGRFTQSKKGNIQRRGKAQTEFLEDFVNSGFPDSFSIYTLELFSGSEWFNSYNEPEKLINCKKYGSEEDVYEEFSILENLVSGAGFKRYEISNFASPGKSSIHNRIYREMKNYIGVGTSASSFVNSDSEEGKKIVEYFSNTSTSSVGHKNLKGQMKGIRWTNSIMMPEYLKGNHIDPNQTVILDEKDYLIEEFFLSLRTDKGVENMEKYAEILVKNRKDLIKKYEEENLLTIEEGNIVLTDAGFGVYNGIVTKLLGEI